MSTYKIKVVEDISDWFHIVEKEFEPDRYDKFVLRANELVWYLEAYKNNVKQWHFQIDNPSPNKLIQDLDITSIVGNRYLKKEELVPLEKIKVRIQEDGRTAKLLNAIMSDLYKIDFSSVDSSKKKLILNGYYPESIWMAELVGYRKIKIIHYDQRNLALPVER